MKAAARPSGADSGHRVQIDVKFVESLTISAAGTTASSSAGAAAGEMRSGWRTRTPVHRDRRLHPTTRAAHLPAVQSKIAMQFVDYVPGPVAVKVEVIPTDNGVEFQSAFHWHVLDKDIGHVYIKSRAPTQRQSRTLQRIDAEEFYGLFDGVVIDDAMVFNDKLKAWEGYCNYHRPHGTLGGQTPNERLRQKPTQVSPIYHSRTR
jgi:transposase InsO family protein